MVKITLGIIFLFCSAAAAVESRLNNSKIEFAVADVGGQTCWTQKEKADTIAMAEVFKDTSPVIAVNFNPTEVEINLSTCILSFNNYGEYRECVLGNKDVLEQKIRELRRAVDDRSDLPAARSRSFISRLNWLRSHYQSLP